MQIKFMIVLAMASIVISTSVPTCDNINSYPTVPTTIGVPSRISISTTPTVIVPSSPLLNMIVSIIVSTADVSVSGCNSGYSGVCISSLLCSSNATRNEIGFVENYWANDGIYFNASTTLGLTNGTYYFINQAQGTVNITKDKTVEFVTCAPYNITATVDGKIYEIL